MLRLPMAFCWAGGGDQRLAQDGIDLARVGRVHPLLLGFKARTRVVVADDDSEMRALLAHVLDEEGYEVIEAADGAELEELLRVDANGMPLANVDAVITDIRMPGPSGLDVLEAVRAADQTTPIILITAFPDQDTEAEGDRLGATAMFSKPFALKELIETLRALLSARLA